MCCYMSIRSSGIIVPMILFFLGACDLQQPVVNHVEWNYDGVVSPEHWAELSSDFLECAEGHFQSPIDLETSEVHLASKYKIKFAYHDSEVDIVNNGHTVQANVEENNLLLINDQSYVLKQVHFHAPAEHQIDGLIYPMEMHMVHMTTDQKIAVVGCFIKEGKENIPLNTLWKSMPRQRQEHEHPSQSCDLIHFLPEDHKMIHYKGSLTTPPCSEGVDWYVMETPISLSKAQINVFKELYDHNNRPIQNREGRALEEIE